MKLRTLILIVALVLGIGSVAYAADVNTLHLDGTNAYAWNDGSGLDIGTGDFSYQIWVKTNEITNSTTYGIMGKTYYGKKNGRWGLYMLNNKLTAIADFGTSNSELNYTIPIDFDSNWHQLTVTLDRDGYMFFYVDGISAGNVSIASYSGQNMQTDLNFYIGAYGDAGSNVPKSGWFFDGAVAEAGIWDRVLTPTEIMDMYSLSINPTTLDGLRAYWRIHEGDGATSLFDVTGNYDLEIGGSNYSWDTTDGIITLPVELSYFNATVTSQYFVELHWMSQTETDMLGYIVLRSEDMKLEHAQQVSPLIDASNTSNQVAYSYTDDDVIEGTWYYWLQSIDLDGSHRFHGPTRAIVNTFQGGSAPSIEFGVGFSNIYPNPFNPSVTIEYKLADDSAGVLKVYNTRGQLVKTINLPAGSHSKVMEASDLPTGVYLFRLETGGKVYSHKAVLTK